MAQVQCRIGHCVQTCLGLAGLRTLTDKLFHKKSSSYMKCTPTAWMMS